MARPGNGSPPDPASWSERRLVGADQQPLHVHLGGLQAVQQLLDLGLHLRGLGRLGRGQAGVLALALGLADVAEVCVGDGVLDRRAQLVGLEYSVVQDAGVGRECRCVARENIELRTIAFCSA